MNWCQHLENLKNDDFKKCIEIFGGWFAVCVLYFSVTSLGARPGAGDRKVQAMGKTTELMSFVDLVAAWDEGA